VPPQLLVTVAGFTAATLTESNTAQKEETGGMYFKEVQEGYIPHFRRIQLSDYLLLNIDVRLSLS